MYLSIVLYQSIIIKKTNLTLNIIYCYNKVFYYLLLINSINVTGN
jgi:hypothetical protein